MRLCMCRLYHLREIDIMTGKHIILGITGGIAAYKSVVLLRLLIKAGAEDRLLLLLTAKNS